MPRDSVNVKKRPHWQTTLPKYTLAIHRQMTDRGTSFFRLWIRANAFQSDHGFPLEWLNLHCTLSRSLMMIMKTHGSHDIDTIWWCSWRTCTFSLNIWNAHNFRVVNHMISIARFIYCLSLHGLSRTPFFANFSRDKTEQQRLSVSIVIYLWRDTHTQGFWMFWPVGRIPTMQPTK